MTLSVSDYYDVIFDPRYYQSIFDNFDDPSHQQQLYDFFMSEHSQELRSGAIDFIGNMMSYCLKNTYGIKAAFTTLDSWKKPQDAGEDFAHAIRCRDNYLTHQVLDKIDQCYQAYRQGTYQGNRRKVEDIILRSDPSMHEQEYF